MTTAICLVFLAVLGCALGQRSPYAPRPFAYPQVLPQYMSGGTGGGDASAAQGDPLDTRLGNDDTTTRRTTTISPNLPGSLQDPELINRVSDWPKEKQPFWYLNAQHLGGHIGYRQDGGQGGQQRGQQGGQLRGQQQGGRQQNQPQPL